MSGAHRGTDAEDVRTNERKRTDVLSAVGIGLVPEEEERGKGHRQSHIKSFLHITQHISSILQRIYIYTHTLTQTQTHELIRKKTQKTAVHTR